MPRPLDSIAKATRVPAWLTLPAVLCIGLLYLAPVLHLILTSIMDDGSGRIQWTFERYISFFKDGYNWQLLARTFIISSTTVLASFVIAFPVALYMRKVSPRTRTILAIVLLSPLLTSVVVRTLAWVVLLGPKGLLNNALALAGFAPLQIMYSNTGIIIGLTHVYFGYMLLSCMASVLKMDDRLILAASNLGASRWQVLWKVILPLSRPGIATGSILVFAMSASAYVTPALLGGSRSKVMATEIYDQAIQYLEWPDAATLACVLFLLVWIITAAISRLGSSQTSRGTSA